MPGDALSDSTDPGPTPAPPPPPLCMDSATLPLLYTEPATEPEPVPKPPKGWPKSAPPEECSAAIT